MAHGAVGQLIGNIQAALAADPHANQALIKTKDHLVASLGKVHRIRGAWNDFPVGAQNHLAVLVLDRRATVVIGGVNFVPVSGQPVSVLNLVELVRLGLGAGTDYIILVAKREDRLYIAFDWSDICGERNARRCYRAIFRF